MDGDKRWRATRQHLERFCPRARRSKFRAALMALERRGADPVVIERTLQHFWGLDYQHRVSQQRKNKGIVFARRRRRVHRNLVAAVAEALRLYKDFYEHIPVDGIPQQTPIYASCRQLSDLLKTAYQDAGPAWPDPLYNDGGFWHEKQLRKAEVGARRKEHKAHAAAALKAAGATTREIPALLVPSIVP